MKIHINLTYAYIIASNENAIFIWHDGKRPHCSNIWIRLWTMRNERL